MNRPHAIHLVRLYAAALTAAVLIFIAGWHMSKGDYRKRLQDAVKAGDPQEVWEALRVWSAKDPDFSKDSLYYQTLGDIHTKNGNQEAAKHNYDKANELGGKP